MKAITEAAPVLGVYAPADPSRDGHFHDIVAPNGGDRGSPAIEASLRQSEERTHQQFLELQQIYDTAPVGRAVLDRNLHYRHVNWRLAEMYGVPATALIGRAVHERSPGAAAPFLHAREVIEAGESKATFEIEGQTAAHPGERRVWMVACAPLKNGEGRVTGINMVVEDVTEHKKAADDIRSVAELLEQRVIERTAELELEAQERREAERVLHQLQRVELIGQLTSGIAHDFNNMLGVIRANVEILARRLGEHSDLRRFTQDAIGGVERAASLTRQLLSFARRHTLDPKPLDVKNQILDMTDLFGRTLGEKIVVETLVPDDLWLALVDVTQFENALLNLVLNARDAMGGAGRVVIKAANASVDESGVGRDGGPGAGDYVRISVIDSGVGMEPDVMALAFEPFFTTKAERGTGLGLAQVYAFTKQSGGHVAIDSAPGEGTSVTLYLPRPVSGTPRRDSSADDQPIPAGTCRETILVVEDDHSVRSSTVDILRDLGYSVLAAPDGSTALHMLDSGAKVDLLFADVGLPGELSGPSLADVATARRPQLKVLFASGYSEEADEFTAPKAGSTLLKKPFTYAALANRVRQALTGNGADDARPARLQKSSSETAQGAVSHHRR